MNLKATKYWTINFLYSLKKRDKILVKICISLLVDSFRFATHIYISEFSYFIDRKRIFPRSKIHKFKNRLIVKKPANLIKEDYDEFKTNHVAIHQLAIIPFDSVLVYVDLYNGVIVDKNIVRQSIHHIGGDRAREVFGSYPQRIYNAMYVATLNGTVQTLDSNINYLWIHNWFNYYHWFTETFLRLWIANESHPDYTILLPEKLREIPFVSQSLSLFPGLRMQFLSSETQVYRIPKLHLVVQKPYCEEYDTDLFPKIANEIKSKILLAEQKIERNSHKVYVSRKQSNRRTFVNESDVVALFERFQYTILYTETMSFSEQVVAFSNTTVLVSMHGAGLTNMMWMPHGSKVFEIHRRIRNRNDHHSLVYYTMASALGHQYYYQWCDDGDNADFFEGNLIVNIEELEKNLIEIEK